MFYSFSTLKVIYLFLTLLTVQSAKNSTSLLSEIKEPEYIPKSCDNRLLKFFLMNPELKNSEKPAKEINRLCPQVQDSCCSANDFDDLLQQILEKQFVVGKTRLQILDLIEWIVNLTDLEINDIVQIVNKKNCIKSENIPLLMARSKLKRDFAHVGKNLNKSFEFFFKLSTSFTCSLCEQSIVKDMIINQSGTGFRMQVNKDICNHVFLEGFQNNNLRIFEYLEYLNVFVEMLGCVANDELSLRPILFKNQYSSIEEKGLYCSTENNWIDNEDCNTLCKDYSMINQNMFSEIMIPIEKSKKYFSDLVKEYFETKNKMIKSSGKQLINKLNLDDDTISEIAKKDISPDTTPNVFSFKFFIEAIGGEQNNPNVMKIELTQNRGVDLTKFHMRLISENINRLFTFVTMSLIVFLFRH